MITLAHLNGTGPLGNHVALKVEQEREKFIVSGDDFRGLRFQMYVPKTVALMFVGAIVLDVASQESEAEERRALRNPPNPS